MPGDTEELRETVRRLHVHYEVAGEVELLDGARVRVGSLVRLWGLHAKGARALPGCLKCRELRLHLERIAAFALAGDWSGSRIEIEPPRSALYDSRVLPGADEIALAIRLARRDARDAPEDGAERRCLDGIRARLRQLGVPER